MQENYPNKAVQAAPKAAPEPARKLDPIREGKCPRCETASPCVKVALVAASDGKGLAQSHQYRCPECHLDFEIKAS